MKWFRSINWPSPRQWILCGLSLLFLAGFLGALVTITGLIPIKASSGHWPPTRWFLQFAKFRSVSLHSSPHQPPADLDHPRRLLPAARHFHTGCRPCHGAPGEPMPRIAAAMTPPPPALADRITLWEPRELFDIVHHGIKFTGMPAWPTQHRPDEVWNMVAFLLALPDMSPERYHQVARGLATEDPPGEPLDDLSAQIAPILQGNCNRCHGPDGTGIGGDAIPILAGQRETYLQQTLHAFAQGSRHSGIMQPLAAALSDQEIDALARHYSRLTPPDALNKDLTTPALQDSSFTSGREIALRGIRDRKVPSCIDCHGPEPSDPQNAQAYPILAGQHAHYLANQLELFQEQHRGGGPYHHLMHHVAPGLSPLDIQNVTQFFASLKR